MRLQEHEFKHALAVLRAVRPDIEQEVRALLSGLNIPLGRGHRPTPSEQVVARFAQAGWARDYAFKGGLKFDLFKDGVAIEVQLSDRRDTYNDLLKFLLAYNLEVIEVGIAIVYGDDCRGRGFEETPRLSHLRRDLELFRRVIPCPIWAIGLACGGEGR